MENKQKYRYKLMQQTPAGEWVQLMECESARQSLDIIMRLIKFIMEENQNDKLELDQSTNEKLECAKS